MAILRLFASVKQMAGTGSVILSGATVADVVEEASQRYGAEFSDMARNCRIWLNGNPTEINTCSSWKKLWRFSSLTDLIKTNMNRMKTEILIKSILH